MCASSGGGCDLRVVEPAGRVRRDHRRRLRTVVVHRRLLDCDPATDAAAAAGPCRVGGQHDREHAADDRDRARRRPRERSRLPRAGRAHVRRDLGLQRVSPHPRAGTDRGGRTDARHPARGYRSGRRTYTARLMRRLLGIRNVRIFVGGWTASVFGDWAMFIVLGVWTKDLTGSNSAAGLVFFALALPSLFSPFAGLVVDRLPRRPLLMWTYAAEAVVVLSLLFVHDRGDVWIIYAVTVFYGAAGTLAASARSALLTVMVPQELLGESNGMLQTLREGLRLVAPLVGALIYASIGGGAVAMLDSASFVAVVVALALIRLEEPRFEREEHFVTELLAGVRHVFATLPLRQIVLATGVCLLVVGFSETLIFAVLDQGL